MREAPTPYGDTVRLDLTGIDPVDHALARRCSVGDLPTRAAATFAGRTALTDDAGSWTYLELEAVSNRFAHGLTAHGIEAEEPVALLSMNCREFVATYFGTAKAGMVSLPINLLSGLDNIEHALTDSGTRILVVHGSLAELVMGAVAAIPAIRTVVVVGGVPDGLEAPADGPALIGWDDLLADDDTNPDTVIGDRQVVQCLYSSGTTSRPKGVLTSHLAVTMAALGNGAVFGLNWGAEASVTVCPLPLFHTAGLNGVLLSAVTMGATVTSCRASTRSNTPTRSPGSTPPTWSACLSCWRPSPTAGTAASTCPRSGSCSTPWPRCPRRCADAWSPRSRTPGWRWPRG